MLPQGASRLCSHQVLGLRRDGARPTCSAPSTASRCMVRFHNHLPSVKIPQAFGIAEMSTHLHNAHTPSESDGNPVNYFNSVNDPNAVNPYGFKDQHYPNVRAGFTARRRPGRRPDRGRWARSGTTTTISISPPRTSTRACSAATTCSTNWTPAKRAPGLQSALQGLRHPDLLPRRPVRLRPARPCSTCSTWTASWATGSSPTAPSSPT